ncbi:CaiB/BaiF CoA-transferase family protein [Novosphingobium pokkalii]|uniref:CaiB/BaiF CoA-transferase family protein n=1 Tax=Novosphingobium pokkalii TaxID=1770194 RepID=UPI0019844B17|nr:CoA transferase [Novosphingobium pokkalii]
MLVQTPLNDELAVVHLGSGLASAYCTKLLVDGGAVAVWVEGPEGDPLRRRSASGANIDPQIGGPLFQFLAASTQSIVVDPAGEGACAALWNLLERADVVIWSPGSPITDVEAFAPARIRARCPHAVVVAITNFGLGMPDRPAAEFTLQAMSGGWASRGRADREPLAAGGDHGDWAVGIFGASGALAAWRRAQATGVGELVDVSILDALHLTQPFFAPTFEIGAGRPYRAVRSPAVPLNHPTRDGYVGFQITTGQQWLDFCILVEQPDWAEDKTLSRFETRAKRGDELTAIIDAWTSQRTTAEVVELATLFRLPVAPIHDGKSIGEFEQVVARGWRSTNPVTGVAQPAPPYIIEGDIGARVPGASPRLGAHDGTVLPARERSPSAGGKPHDLPFEGVRILDFTAFWAGPIITHFFAMFGADVIHVESIQRPDGIRAATLRHDMSEGWWEASPFFAGTNTNKRGLTLDMGQAEARELVLKLVAQSDVLVENFSSRVMQNWGLTYEKLREINPRLIMVRASGFGNSGPWKDHVAYATTVEQASGLSWVTGFADDRPEITGGACDPIAGSHAAFALMLALAARDRTGNGMLVETPQFTTGFNISAEQLIEYSAHGVVLGRNGNRSWVHAPQGAYRAVDWDPPYDGMSRDDWVAISVTSDAEWKALCATIGAAALAADPGLSTPKGRMECHDVIDQQIAEWVRPQRADDAVAALLAAGVPAARFQPLAGLHAIPEVVARGLYEEVDQPVLGRVPIIGYPAKFEFGPYRLHRSPAPMLGQHNAEILTELLGLSEDDVTRLEAAAIIGTRPRMGIAW